MKNSENELKKISYYRIILPSNIKVEKEDIFLREKYNDIMNYFKVLLTSDEYSEIQPYFEPNGLLLVNISPGTDISNFLRLISKNYYLDFIELDYFEILRSPSEFLNNFNLIFQNMLNITQHKERVQNESKTYPENFEKVKLNRLILINQSELPANLFKGRNLLKVFLTFQKRYNSEYLKNGSILVWLNENFNDIRENSYNVYQIFDLVLRVPPIGIKEREVFLRNYSEGKPKIVFDISTLINYTRDWEILDIKNLIKLAIFKHFLNFELNKTSNEITDVITNLIDSGEFKPSIYYKDPRFRDEFEDLDRESLATEKHFKDKELAFTKLQSIVSEIQDQPISEFMLSQLYENAASKNYTELVIIIDKLNKNEILEENERKLLANYPFILNNSPNRAQIHLEKAKKKIDHIRQSFGR
ncbi:MAG: hypothetical protein ACFFBH_11865 [Promethearchaeota archaeon]